MNRPSGPRKTASLSDSIHQQLSMYAIAATAAGVEMLALAQPSEAKIFYTPAHQVIKPNQAYDLDLNHDGIIDFTIRNGSRGSFYNIALTESAPAGNSVVGFKTIVGASSSIWCASALTRGKVIGARRKFTSGGRPALLFYSGPSNGRVCPWNNVANRYLGVRFKIKGRARYGWARLSVVRIISTTGLGYAVAISGYAYETIPGKAIVAGQTKGPGDESSVPVDSLDAPSAIPARIPAMLGLLAMGAPGLSIWRREEP
jgi:hypothetical protein